MLARLSTWGCRIVTGREYARQTKERGRSVERFEIPGNVTGTTLVFAPAADGRLIMTAHHFTTPAYNSVVLQPEWLRPLAAWLAGDARPGIVGHDEYGMPYGRWLTVAGDETAVAYETRATAELTCRQPYGTARIAVGPRNRPARCAVMLSPDARTRTAAYLRRVDAESWTAQPF